MLTFDSPRRLPTSASALLWRFYEYVGAHNHPHRFENERDRAWQRVVIPTLSIAWVFAYHRMVGTPANTAEYVWMCTALAYGASSAAYWIYLGRNPDGGVHAQYAFLALDMLIVGWALFAAPEALAWWLVLMLVMIARVGFRYGLNAMKVELGFAWLGAAVPLLFSGYWHSQVAMSAALILMLICAWWLFAPLHRLLEKAKSVELEAARIHSLRESLNAKSEFLSRVSHELRSPLQGVISALDLIEGRIGRDPKEAELLSRIRRGATALNTQLRDLLTLARGDVGKMELNPHPFEAGELVASVAREIEPEALAKGLVLRVRTPEGPVFVVADSARIDQVLTNLLTNATRHTKQGSVALTLHPYDMACRCLRFTVEDTGPGIDKDQIPKLFEPYTRFGELTLKGDGAGLGLAVVRAVLRFLGGTETVESQPGHGTTITVEIPAELLDPEARADPAPGTRRFLVVDDTPAVLEAISSVVRQLGAECDTALSAATAANLLGAKTYDIVFVDLDMPVKDGLDLGAETRRGKGPNRQARMYSISADDSPYERSGSPFDGHLTKPITKLAIQRVIEPPMSSASATR